MTYRVPMPAFCLPQWRKRLPRISVACATLSRCAVCPGSSGSGFLSGLAKTRYVNDKADHRPLCYCADRSGIWRHAQPFSAVHENLRGDRQKILKHFYPAAIYQKYALELTCGQEHFFTSFRVLTEPGYLKVAEVPKRKKRMMPQFSRSQASDGESDDKDESETNKKRSGESGVHCHAGFLKKWHAASGGRLCHQGRGDLSSKALFFRFHDPGYGERGTAH